MAGMSLVRQQVQRIDGVSGSWFEHEERNGMLTRTLVVEVIFDTDPSSDECKPNRLDAIYETVKSVLAEETTQIISGIRIVPRAYYNA